MEKHKCGICSKCFSSGKALGGHMRSHLSFHPIPPKRQQPLHNPSEEKEEEEVSSHRASSIVDSSQPSKDSEIRLSKMLYPKPLKKKCKYVKTRRVERKSAISSSMEDIAALSILMLSEGKTRDSENREEKKVAGSIYVDNDESPHSTKVLKTLAPPVLVQAHPHSTCRKKSQSHPAIERHRSKHAEIGAGTLEPESGVLIGGCNGGRFEKKRRKYECPFCFRVFKSGQAMGGHKKIHSNPTLNSKQHGGDLIDLNFLPSQEDGGN